jgi:hypothetical protein
MDELLFPQAESSCLGRCDLIDSCVCVLAGGLAAFTVLLCAFSLLYSCLRPREDLF